MTRGVLGNHQKSGGKDVSGVGMSAGALCDEGHQVFCWVRS